MAANAPYVLYKDEFIAGFERRTSKLRGMVTREVMVKGLSATFLVADSGARTAVTRGANGYIPASSDNLVQPTVTLIEKHDLTQKTGFNLFTGQADQRRIMQETGMAVLNRDIDDTIIATLATATQNVTVATFNKTQVNKATTKLWNNNVPNDGEVYGLVTPAAWAELSDIPQFTSSDYVNNRPLADGAPTGEAQTVRWMGVTWMMHTGLPNRGTSTAQCFIFHRNAIGHAVATGDIQVEADYNREQDYSWARHTIYHNALILQNTGIVTITHDDTVLS